jgi:ketol-acid reductoisomerase
LVAPHGPGRDLEAGQPMSGFVGVAHDATGRALRRARLYARTVGLKPLFETSPRSEALGDLFGEQTLLCGGLVGLASAVAGVMVRRGIEPAHAWFETVGQLETLARLLAGRGMRGFWDEISDCAAFGSARAAPRLFGPEFARALGEVWKDVESGRFAEEFQKRGRPRRYPREWEVLEQIDRARRGAGGAIRGGRTSGTTRGRVTRSPVARPRTVGRRGTTSRKKKGGRGGHPS